MFERFSASALAAMARAQIEARSLGQGQIGAEHVLLALSGQPDTTAGAALHDCGITLERLRADLIRRWPAPPFGSDDATLLRAIGIELDDVRQAVKLTLGPDAAHVARQNRRPLWFRQRRGSCHSILLGEMGVNPRLKRSFELAVQHADRDGREQVDDGFLLLGLVEDRQGLAALLVSEQIGDVALLEETLRHRLLA